MEAVVFLPAHFTARIPRPDFLGFSADADGHPLGHRWRCRWLEQPGFCRDWDAPFAAADPLGVYILHDERPQKSGAEPKGFWHSALDHPGHLPVFKRLPVCRCHGEGILSHDPPPCGAGSAVCDHRQLFAEMQAELHHWHQDQMDTGKRRKLECHPPLQRQALGDRPLH